jgi:hypothetical protein
MVRKMERTIVGNSRWRGLDISYASVDTLHMKVAAKQYRIETPDQGRTWRVVEKATGSVVWTGKTFRGARTAHAQRELGMDYRSARRMGNA